MPRTTKRRHGAIMDRRVLKPSQNVPRSALRQIRLQAIDRLHALAVELERSHPGAAGSLREGLVETLTVARLGITGSLKRTLASTNPCESMIECIRRTSRNVKRWQSGEMALRWTAAGMLEAERQFRRIIGHRDLAKLAVAIERDLAHTTPVASPTEEAGAAQRRAPVVALARDTGEEVIGLV